MIIGKSAATIIGIILFIIAISIEDGGGNSSIHVVVGVIFLIVSAVMLKRQNVTYTEIFIGAASGALSFFLADYFDNGSMLKLCGATVLIIVMVNFFNKLSTQQK